MTINKLGRITAITILASLAAVAQDNPRFEVGIRGGGGSYGAFDDSRSNPLASIGVEACAFCNGHAGLFAEYSHWLPTATVPSSAVNSADLFGFGLRLQGKRSEEHTSELQSH